MARNTLTAAPGLPAARRGSLSPLARREMIDGYLFILPWLAGFILFTAGPMAASLYLAFVDWDPLTATGQWVGLANLQRLIGDQLVWISLGNTAYYTFFSVPLRLLVALAAALLLSLTVKGLPFFRTCFYLPAVVPAVASAILWMWLYNPAMGLFNLALTSVGLPRQNWLWDVNLAKPSLILMSLWSIGTVMVIFLAGLQAIPRGLYEAAEIDGAGRWARFRHVTLPMLSPTILFNLVIGIIFSFQVFTPAFLMTQGGPVNATLFTVLYLYQVAFERFQMGYASAIAWVLFLVILVFTLIQWKLADYWVYYEGKK